jgi:hypothetical protein
MMMKKSLFLLVILTVFLSRGFCQSCLWDFCDTNKVDFHVDQSLEFCPYPHTYNQNINGIQSCRCLQQKGLPYLNYGTFTLTSDPHISNHLWWSGKELRKHYPGDLGAAHFLLCNMNRTDADVFVAVWGSEVQLFQGFRYSFSFSVANLFSNMDWETYPEIRAIISCGGKDSTLIQAEKIHASQAKAQWKILDCTFDVAESGSYELRIEALSGKERGHDFVITRIQLENKDLIIRAVPEKLCIGDLLHIETVGEALKYAVFFEDGAMLEKEAKPDGSFEWIAYEEGKFVLQVSGMTKTQKYFSQPLPVEVLPVSVASFDYYYFPSRDQVLFQSRSRHACSFCWYKNGAFIGRDPSFLVDAGSVDGAWISLIINKDTCSSYIEKNDNHSGGTATEGTCNRDLFVKKICVGADFRACCRCEEEYIAGEDAWEYGDAD